MHFLCVISNKCILATGAECSIKETTCAMYWLVLTSVYYTVTAKILISKQRSSIIPKILIRRLDCFNRGACPALTSQTLQEKETEHLVKWYPDYHNILCDNSWSITRGVGQAPYTHVVKLTFHTSGTNSSLHTVLMLIEVCWGALGRNCYRLLTRC